MRKFAATFLIPLLVLNFSGILLLVPQKAYAATTVIFLTTTGTNTWTVPDDWNSSSNSIFVIGAGGGGTAPASTGGGGGGGGAFSGIVNLALTPGASVTYRVGSGGGAGAAGGDTFFNRTAGSANTCADTVSVCAKGGSGASATTGGSGGSEGSGVGTTLNSGGTGGNGGNAGGAGGGGGGGAAGPSGDGANGGAGSTSQGGGGGGGANSGVGGGSASSQTGANGGNGRGGSGGGLGGQDGFGNETGANGSNGGGGGGGWGGSFANENIGDGGIGGVELIWTSSPGGVIAGPSGGGGGAGGNSRSDLPDSNVGGAGGGSTGYGGGGGGGGDNDGTAGSGRQGIIVITYTPGSGRTALSKPANKLGLVGYWSLNEGTGTEVTDFSGNRHTGTLGFFNGGLPQWTTGKFNFGLRFPSDNRYIQVPSFDQDLLPATLSGWFKVSASDVTTCGMTIRDPGSASSLMIPGCADETKLGYEWDNDFVNAFSWAGGPSYPLDKWFFAAVVVEDDQATLYSCWDNRCNSAVNSVTHDPVTFTDLEFGWQLGFDDHAFQGNMDELRIYNRALSPTEIERLAKSGAVKFGSSAVELQQGTTLASGLVGYWTFDGLDTLSNITDRSGQGNTGYMMNMASSTAKVQGKLGQGMAFDATDDYVTTALDPASLDLTSTLSISAWVKKNSMSGIDYMVSKGTANHLNLQYALRTNGGVFSFTNSSLGIYEERTDATFSSGAWYHIVATFDDAADDVDIYVNGIEAATSPGAGDAETQTITSNNEPVRIGELVNTNECDCVLDDVRIYNRVLSPAEIKQLSVLGGTTLR